MYSYTKRARDATFWTAKPSRRPHRASAMCGNNPNLAPEVNTAKCIGGTALGFAIVTVVGILLDWPGFISAAAGILSIIGNSIICCCGPKGKGEGAGKFTAAMVLNIIACVLHFAAIIGVIVFYLAMVATVATETEKCVECVCRDEYKAQQDRSYRRVLFESPHFVDEKAFSCASWEGYDCSELEATWGYTAAGAAAVRENCADTCLEYGEARRLQQMGAMIGIKASVKTAVKVNRRKLQQRDAQAQADYDRCTALVATDMTQAEQEYYNTCKDDTEGSKAFCDLMNFILLATLTFYLIIMIPTMAFALISGILEAIAAAKCSAAKKACGNPATATV